MKTAMTLTTLFCLPSLLCFASETVVNENFEAPFQPLAREELREGQFVRSGALPPGWADNSEWGQSRVAYSAASDAHGGKQALRIQISNLVGNSAAQFVRRGIPLRKGRIYAFSIALRSDDSLPVEFGFRSPGKPYTWQIKHTIATTPEWAVWEFAGTAAKDDPSAMLILRIDREGSVNVDDLRIEALSEDEYARRHPAQPGNILQTTRFPLGPANGWTLPRGDAYSFDPVKGETGPSGAPPLKFTTKGPSAPIVSPPMRLRPGQLHVVSFYARGLEPEAKINANIHLARFRETAPVAAKTFALTDKWQRYAFTGVTPFSDMSAYLYLAPSKSALIDAIQVEEGTAPSEYAGQKPAEVCAVPTRDYGVFFEGEPLEFKAAATGRWEKGSKLKARIVDLFDRAQDLPDIELAPSPFETQISVPFHAVPLGFYRLELQAVDPQGKAVSPYGEALAARILRPRFPDVDLPDSPFGIHISATEKQASLAQALGLKWIRCHDAAAELTKWYFLEPKRGEWHWQDAKVDLIRKHHLMILGTLDTSPVWASRGEPDKDKELMRIKNYMPKDLDAWTNYCRTIVARYKGKIDAWEIWNEPYYVGFFRDVVDGKIVHATPEQFAEVVKRAYAAAHQSNPNCAVLTSVGTVPGWTAGCVRSGAVNFADLFTHHQYSPQIPGGPGDALAVKLADWRKELPAALRAKISWDTEGGPTPQTHTFYSHLPTGEARKDARYYADFVPRYYISALALGVPKFFLYSFHSHGGVGNPSCMLVNGDGTLEPLASAISALTWHLEGRRFARIETLTPTAWAYLFTDNETSVAAIVHAPGKTCELKKIDGAECRDLCGNVIPLPATVGPETCYLTYKGSAGSLAKALETK